MLDNRNGGIKMVDVETFLKALKITWLRRLVTDELPWIKFIELTT